MSDHDANREAGILGFVFPALGKTVGNFGGKRATELEWDRSRPQVAATSRSDLANTSS
jgi:hypothetical protein